MKQPFAVLLGHTPEQVYGCKLCKQLHSDLYRCSASLEQRYGTLKDLLDKNLGALEHKIDHRSMLNGREM